MSPPRPRCAPPRAGAAAESCVLPAARTTPTFVYSYTEPAAASRAVLRDMGLPLFSSLIGCAQAVAALVRSSQPVVDAPTGDSVAMTRALHRLIAFEGRDGPLC